MRIQRAFTIIEVLLVMGIIVVISGLVYPHLSQLVQIAPTTTMSYTVRQIRQQITYHGQAGDCALSEWGFPSDVEDRWFTGGQKPTDPWTYRALKVQVVSGPKDTTAPVNITFNVASNSHTAWYNKSNGSFCVMVPKRGSTAEQEALFNLINGIEG